MKSNIKWILIIGLMCLSACGTTDMNESEKESELEQTIEETQQTETTERLKTTDFNNLSKVAEQVGFSFRALDSLDADDDENNSFKFQNFSISTEKETEINGMKLDDPSYVVKLNYKKRGLIEAFVTIFAYDGEQLNPTLQDPRCFVSKEKINEIDVWLSEYILRFIPKDYELTEEDYALMENGNIDFSCDGVTLGDSYFRAFYWVQDGVYYELDVREENYPLETLKKMVNDIMTAEIL